MYRRTIASFLLSFPSISYACVVYTPVSFYLLVIASLVVLWLASGFIRITREERAHRWNRFRLLLVVYFSSVFFLVSREPQCPGIARIPKAKSEINSLVSALQMYKLENSVFPSTAQGLESLIEKPTISPEPLNWMEGGYLGRLPLDPWGRAYLYRNPGENSAIEVFSYGRDGKPGGSGEDADIFSSN